MTFEYGPILLQGDSSYVGDIDGVMKFEYEPNVLQGDSRKVDDMII